MIGRYAFATVVGVVVTISLLFIMQLLIATGQKALSEPRERAQLDFVRVKRNETLNTQEIIPEKPPKPRKFHPKHHRSRWTMLIPMHQRSTCLHRRLLLTPTSVGQEA